MTLMSLTLAALEKVRGEFNDKAAHKGLHG